MNRDHGITPHGTSLILAFLILQGCGGALGGAGAYDGGPIIIQVSNQSSFDVCEGWVVPAAWTDWGGYGSLEERMAPGGTSQFSSYKGMASPHDIEPGSYDIRFKGCGDLGTLLVQYEVEIAGPVSLVLHDQGTTPTVTAGQVALPLQRAEPESRIPQAAIRDLALEQAMLATATEYARSEGWTETFRVTILREASWAPQRHETSGRIIAQARTGRLGATRPSGVCTFQDFIFWQEYVGSQFEGPLELRSFGDQMPVPCETIELTVQQMAEAPPAATPAAAPEASIAVNGVDLDWTRVEPMGLSIYVPRGANALASGAASTVYALPIAGTGNALTVELLGYGESSLARAEASATQAGGAVAESRALENGLFEVVLAPRGVTQRVYAFTGDRGAICHGPPGQLEVLQAMCSSLTQP